MQKSSPGIVWKTLIISALALGLQLAAWRLVELLAAPDAARLVWSLRVIAPLCALLVGIGCALWGLSLWPALVAALAAEVVGLELAFGETALAYVPVYLALAAAGVALGHLARGRRG